MALPSLSGASSNVKQPKAEAFLAKGTNFSELLSHLPEIAHEAKGADLVLERLEESSQAQVNAVAAVVANDAHAMASRAQPAQLLQKLIELAGPEEVKAICDFLAPSAQQLSVDVHGCRVLQKAMEFAPLQAKERLISGLQEGALYCMKNMHGNHVMQMCIEQMPPTSVDFVVEAVISWGADKAACHMYACRVVMRILEHCTEPQVRTLLAQILNSATRLAQDRYGNYVLQHVLEHGRPEAQRSILVSMLGAPDAALEFAKHKYAHNVVEKCVILASDLEQSRALPPPPGLESEGQILLRDALLPESSGEQPLVLEHLASDRFGSQVVLRLLENCQGPTRELLLSQLRSSATRLQGLDYTAPILALL